MVSPTRSQVPDYWPLFEAYHRVREPLYRAIILDAGLADGRLILDAGCGDGFYSRLLANALGSSVHVVGVDLNPALLRHAPDRHPSVHRLITDLEQSGLKRGALCAVWMSRAMYSAPDPVRRLSALVPLLRPGGTLVVVENDFPHYPILSWPTDFDRRIVDARYRFLESQSAGGWSPDRFRAACYLPTWLEVVGLRDVSIRTHVSEDVAPLTGEVERYWQLAMHWQGRLLRPLLSAADWRFFSRAFDPDAPEYVLRQPGFHLLELTAVARGTAP